jgi:YD repeat-containing protein
MKKILLVILAFVVLQGALGMAAHAQSGSNCVIFVGNGCIYGNYVVGPCPGWFNCSPSGPFLLVCQAMSPQCSPVAGPIETCPKCGSGTANAGSPISLTTGNTYIELTDVRIPGLSGGLSLVRTWNSQWPSTQIASQVGSFGPNWRSTYEERVFFGSDNYYKYARADGSFWSFGTNGGVWSLAAPSNVSATLTLDSALTQWTLTFQNGERRTFNYVSGSLTSIIDRNGNTTQLSYDALNRLVTVTDPASRHLYFGYASGSSFLVTSVTSDFGITISYAYDAQGRLITVTRPGQTTLSFTYDANSRITAVTDSDGKILESHTYDSNGRGLTSSRAGGVDAVTVTYPHP